MLVEKTVKSWMLSDNDKKVIKENAKDLRDFLKSQGYNTYRELYEEYRSLWVYDWFDFYKFIEDYLPFVKEEKLYINISELLTEIDSAIRNLEKTIIADKYNKENLIEKLFSSKNSKIINYLLND